MPLILGGGDVMAAAETGSGKTGAFALPVLQIVHETLRTRQRTRQNASGSEEGPGEPAACVLNAEDRDSVVAVAPDGLCCQARSEAAWGGVRGAVGAFAGKVYWEATVADEGLCRCGLRTRSRVRATLRPQQRPVPAPPPSIAAHPHTPSLTVTVGPRCPSTPRPCRVGWSTLSATLDLGTDRLSFGYGGTGKKSHTRSFGDYGQVRAAAGLAVPCDWCCCWMAVVRPRAGPLHGPWPAVLPPTPPPLLRPMD